MQHELSTRELARIELHRQAACAPQTLERAFLAAARLSARTLKLARVGIWFFQDDGASIRCQYLYDAAADRGGVGEVIELTSCPRYAAAIGRHRTITAHDALHDPRTEELAPYLRDHGIGSVMDCPIFKGGEPLGILCHEHVGAPRTWSKEEAAFAATVSDMLGLYLEQDEARRHYCSLLDARGELERARVMESVGRMAAGVAHDFNNVLSALSAHAELSRLTPDPSRESLQQSAEETQRLVEQGARLVQQLLDVARQEPSGNHTDLVQVLAQLAPFLRTLERDGVRLDLRRASGSAPIPVAQSRVEQVITNLAVNARDAMLGGGTLTLEVGEREVEGARSVFLRVADTGVGMDEHTRERVFEPYFTTKSDGHGLGLATVYRIVRDSGGTIALTTAPGAGAEFLIAWPAR